MSFGVRTRDHGFKSQIRNFLQSLKLSPLECIYSTVKYIRRKTDAKYMWDWAEYYGMDVFTYVVSLCIEDTEVPVHSGGELPPAVPGRVF